MILYNIYLCARLFFSRSIVPEHAQTGFLSGTNFLLPWDVQVRLENAASWQRTLDKARHRRKPHVPPPHKDDSDRQVFMLKIFVGCEYECPRGHRFFMNSPETILRGGAGIHSFIIMKIEFTMVIYKCNVSGFYS